VEKRNILIMKQGRIVYSNPNETGNLNNIVGYTGSAESVIAAILMDGTILQSYIAGINLYPYLARINAKFSHLPYYKMRISGKKRTIKGTSITSGSFFVDYISYDRKTVDKKRFPRIRIDILNLELILDHPPVDAYDQFKMVKAIIRLHEQRGVKRIRASRGAIGAALLRHSPEWKKGRHAAPRFINQISRKYLPGNYYAISRQAEETRLKRFKHCYYVDQFSAHHNIVTQITIPHPHTLRARGNWQNAIQKDSYYPPWARPGTDIFEKIEKGELVGLVLARVLPHTLPPNEFHLYPPWAKKKSEYVWLWTPDIEFVSNNFRIELDYIVAGFLGSMGDTALSEYGTWALDYLGSFNREKIYTKSSLLAAYGMLGFNNEKNTDIRKYWGGNTTGTKILLPEAGPVTERVIKFKEGTQHNLVNVVARGLIEAETRYRTLEYAKELYSQGIHVIQIYADGMLVEADQLPFLPTGWRITESLTNVYVPRTNAFISDQLSKIPGIPKTEDDAIYLDRREKSRKPLTGRRPAGIML
jgi:hypothetical protein